VSERSLREQTLAAIEPAPTAPKAAVRDFYDDYAGLLDDGDFEAWLELFTADCQYQVMARENFERGLPLATMRCDSRAMLADRIAAIRNTQFFAPRTLRHFVSGVRLKPPAPDESAGTGAEGSFEATANFLVTETFFDGPSALHTVGQYVDRFVWSQGRLLLQSKMAVYDAGLVTTSLVYPL